MTDYTELKRLAEALLASDDHADFPGWMAASDAFDNATGPAAILAPIAENEALRSAIQAITAQIDGNIRPTVRDCVNGQNNVQDIYGYCDQIESIAAAAMKEPQP